MMKPMLAGAKVVVVASQRAFHVWVAASTVVGKISCNITHYRCLQPSALLGVVFRPDQASSVRTSPLLNVLARSEALPQVAEEVALLLDVAFTKKRSDSPCSFLSMVKGDASAEC
jgi:hypothetical protein